MGGVRQRHRVTATGLEQGFTLVEVLVALAITGLFLAMVSGVLQSSSQLAQTQQARAKGRSASRFALEFMASELSTVGSRLPQLPPFIAAEQVNNSDDEDRADVGTDAFTTVRLRSGLRTPIQALAGDAEEGTLELAFHTADESGDNPICPDEETCEAAFGIEFATNGGYLAVGSEGLFWLLRLTSDPVATLGADGNISVDFEAVMDNSGGASFSEGDVVVGVEVRTFRIMDQTLQMKEDFFDVAGQFLQLAEDIEDMQIGFILNDGTYLNTGLPGEPRDVRGTAISLVRILPNDMSVGSEMFQRPAVEDREAADELDRRRRIVDREIVWSRNLG